MLEMTAIGAGQVNQDAAGRGERPSPSGDSRLAGGATGRGVLPRRWSSSPSVAGSRRGTGWRSSSRRCTERGQIGERLRRDGAVHVASDVLT
jgi:hypothetical protein